VTIDTLVGPCCPPIQGWRRHDESHFLRALGTKQRPGVSRDCLVRHMIMHRHMNSLPWGNSVARDQARPKAESRLYKIAHWARAFQSPISGTGVPETPRTIIEMKDTLGGSARIPPDLGIVVQDRNLAKG
jgi:hypothetical protein